MWLFQGREQVQVPSWTLRWPLPGQRGKHRRQQLWLEDKLCSGATSDHQSGVGWGILQSTPVSQVWFLNLVLGLNPSSINEWMMRWNWISLTSISRFKQCRKAHCEHIDKIDRFGFDLIIFIFEKHRNYCECCPCHSPTVSQSSSMSWCLRLRQSTDSVSSQGGDESVQGDVLCLSSLLFPFNVWKVGCLNNKCFLF